MAHAHGVFDTDTHFKIDGITRAVQNRTETKVMVVQKDHNSERFTFEVPRYIEAHDMSTCNLVQVHYLNIDAVTKKKYSGVYTVDDLRISEENDELVLCSWLVSAGATQHVGSLNFVVRFACVKDGVITYAWHTAVHTGVTVSASIDAAEMFEDQYLDIIEQWKESVVQGFADDLVIEAKKAATAQYAELTARVDNLIASPVVDDTEVIDIRVGADGVTYDSAGTAVRNQISDINNRVASLAKFAGDTEADITSWFNLIEGAINNSTGAFVTYTGNYATKIPVSIGFDVIQFRFNPADNLSVYTYALDGTYQTFKNAKNGQFFYPDAEHRYAIRLSVGSGGAAVTLADLSVLAINNSNKDQSFTEENTVDRLFALESRMGFTFDGMDKGQIIFMFDDALPVTSDILSVFQSNGAVFSMAVPCNNLYAKANDGRYMNEVLLDMQSSGGEVLAHGLDWTTLKGLSKDEIEVVLKTSKQTLQNAGFEVHGWISPDGVYNENGVTLFPKYYRYGYRATANAKMTQFNMSRPNITSLGIDETKALIDKCENERTVQILFAHFSDNELSAFSLADLETVLQYALEKNVAITTYRNVFFTYGSSI